MRMKLIEVCGVVTLLTLTGLCGIANSWNECEPDLDARETAVAYITWEFKSLLQLDANQARKIKQINYEFYDEASKLYEADLSPVGTRDLEVRQLLSDRTTKIMTVLSEKQKTIWHKANRKFDQQFLTMTHR